ncbi:MAG: YhjD/YihY/BrkB family envelope integrity protein [Alphaproteobacteria bacterium]|nr:YhjD/YihY/BrkB family envelope integrity protein [Alphaproteobacteria bacterium]
MIADALDKLNEKIWGAGIYGRPFFLRWPLLTLRLLMAVGRDLKEGYLGLRATSLVYTTLLSFAPVLAISFSVLKGIGAHNNIEPFLQDFLEPLGEQGAEITARTISFVDNIQVGVLGAVGMALLIYSVIALMHKIETAFNDIWHVSETRSFAQRVRDYLGVLFIGPLLLFLSVAMTTTLQHAEKTRSFLQEYLGAAPVDLLFGGIFQVVPYVLFGVAFAALYMFMPNTRVRLLPALVAGFITGILWKVLGQMFGVFVAGSANYAAIYSAFAALILFMIWIYIGWLIVLVGAALCYYIQNPSNQQLSRKDMQLSPHLREKVALHVCAVIGDVFYSEQRGITLTRLAARLRVPSAVLEGIVSTLVDAGVLALTVGRNAEYLPGRPFDTTSVQQMIEALRARDAQKARSLQHIRALAPVDDLLQRGDIERGKALGAITLKQLAQGKIPA